GAQKTGDGPRDSYRPPLSRPILGGAAAAGREEPGPFGFHLLAREMVAHLVDAVARSRAHPDRLGGGTSRTPAQRPRPRVCAGACLGITGAGVWPFAAAPALAVDGAFRPRLAK